MKPLLILLLSCVMAWAQVPISKRLPWFSGHGAGVPGPASIAGLTYWWVSLDMPTNTIATNWVDRINSVLLTQANTSKQPTNSALGVGLNGTTFLTNKFGTLNWGQGFGSGNNTVFVVYQATSLSGFNTILGFSGGGEQGLLYENPPWSYKASVNVAFTGGTTTINTERDLELVWSGTTYTFYTNGILCKTATATPSSLTFDVLGCNQSATAPPGIDFWKGYIVEIGFYTNTSLTSGNVSTLHNYFTNTYNYAP